MARYTGAVCRLCRREGEKLFLKGDRCFSDKCSVARRSYPPGQHGQGRKKVTEHGIHLRAKQKARRYYGVLEGQFYKYYKMAERKEGMAGENLFRILESRLDNVVYRLGFANSRAEARQLTVHNHFTVNGKKVNVPSYLLKEGDVVAVKDKSKSGDKFKAIFESTSSRPVPEWLSLDKTAASGSVTRMANREDIDLDVAENLIVELYSK